MQLTGYVAHVFSRKRWKPSDYLLTFMIGREKKKTESEETVEEAKARWFNRLNPFRSK
jgi:hypothetical protein